MQTTGEICHLCGHPVQSEVEAATCQHCHAAFHKCCLTGGTQVCIHCGELYAENAEATSANRGAEDSPLRFVEGELQRPKTSWLYHFSLVLVSLAMVMLPLIYVGLVAAFACAVVWYAIHAAPMLTATNHGLNLAIILVFFYLGFLIAGAMLTFFLVKPLFAPRREASEPFALNHADAPQLFALIGWICRSLNAPIPSRIDVTCEVNAGAGFRSGLRSMFGNDISLTIGLPLVAGLNLSQFAGVIAHEYGHFSQGTAMRAHYLIRRINIWFYRVVLEKDAWDMRLIQLTEGEGESATVRLLFYLARSGVWFGRGILWVLMAVGNLLSSFMSRQMEFDADQYELKMCGSENFISTVLRLQQLNLGMKTAQKQLVKKWKSERKLFNQFTDFIVSCANEIPADTQERHYAQAFKRKTRLFDSHPSDAVRMERARAAHEPGVFHDTRPAASLFTDYPELSRRLTVFFYRDLIGPGFSEKSLVKTGREQAQVEHDYAADRENIKRFFLGVATDSRPIVFSENKTPVVRGPEMLTEEIKSCRRLMEESQADAQAAFVEFTEAEARLSQADIAAKLLETGFHFDPADFGLGEIDAEAVQLDASGTMMASSDRLEAFEDAGRMRLLDAAQLLRSPHVAAAVPNSAKLQEEAREMIWVLVRLGDLFEPLLELRKDCDLLEAVLSHRRNQTTADNVTSALDNLCIGIQERVNAINEKVAQIRYPFAHATEQAMVSDYARNKEYHADPFELALRDGRSYSEKLLNLYCRALSNLVVICETVERIVI